MWNHRVERCIWKTWCRLINIIRRLQTEDDCGCQQGFRTWYLLSCVMSHQDSFTFILPGTMSECFKFFTMCPTFVLIEIMTAGHKNECDVFPKWLIWEFSDLPLLWLSLGNKIYLVKVRKKITLTVKRNQCWLLGEPQSPVSSSHALYAPITNVLWQHINVTLLLREDSHYLVNYKQNRTQNCH